MLEIFLDLQTQVRHIALSLNSICKKNPKTKRWKDGTKRPLKELNTVQTYREYRQEVKMCPSSGRWFHICIPQSSGNFSWRYLSKLSSQGDKKTSPFPSVWEEEGPAQVSYKGKECCSAVRWMYCCKQSLTEQGATAAHGMDFMTCYTSALLLVVSVSLCNASEVRSTLGKWWTFALAAFSASAGSNPDL